jgi:hypothetical protein
MSEEANTTTNPKKTFTIGDGTDTETVTGRKDAVRKARELSERTWRPVRIMRADERVEMTFRRGELMNYAYRARRGGRR